MHLHSELSHKYVPQLYKNNYEYRIQILESLINYLNTAALL